MLGAIIGDVVGSSYEFSGTKDYGFGLFPEGCGYTDGTITSLAVASTLIGLEHGHYTEYEYAFEEEMVRLGHMFPAPKGGYGGGFSTWLFHPEKLESYDGKAYQHSGRHPYYSNGNGAAVRTVPVGWLYDGVSGRKRTCRASRAAAALTHDSPEGISGAMAVANAVYYARIGKTKEEIRHLVEDFGYDLGKTWEYWHARYKPDGSCQGTVPQAVTCFLDSTGFEDAVRKAVSLGGDSSALASIAGGIAEAYYKRIPRSMAYQVLPILPAELEDILFRFLHTVGYSDIVKFT